MAPPAWGATAPPPPPTSGQFQVTLTKSAGEVLGFGVAVRGRAMIIHNLTTPSLVTDWNTRNPARKVCVGDRIVAVNGVSHDLWEMIAELHKVGVLNIRITRGGLAAVPQLRPACPSRMDLFLSLQFRSLGPEDYERLSQLDENIPCRDTLPQILVNALPTITVDKCGEGICRVCLDEIEVDSHILQLPCGHAFHHDCISKWLTQSKRRCPLCFAHVDVNLDATDIASMFADTGDDCVPLFLPDSPIGKARGATHVHLVDA
eukprot:CAMPEP_0170607504 /NCGR_PEP_ID=MMETSP0224-20130122/21090_1 /TAXON_ID=285029 /ORGANISM="Togula jolla, Strain CCCM 725" /LENGTH=260 /DNA_ID=CAMNT_0010932675 /DNA_START=72 /DNA_END=854 /DNA_ORIENTATION=+